MKLRAYPCPLCGCARSRVVMKKRGVAIPLEFSIVACRECRHLRVDPRVADEELDALYDAAYYRGEGFDRTIDYDAAPTPAQRAADAAIVDSITEARAGSLRGVRWLDVGCGAGGLLEEVVRRGGEGCGVDSSPAARALCASKGITLLTDDELEARKGTFDVVSAVEVIEHVPDPRGLLALLRACTRPDGLIFVGTGNWNLVRREPGTPYVMPEGHIQYFTPDAMRRLFGELALREADVLNRTWFVDRLLPRGLRSVVHPRMLHALARVACRMTPGLAPFPIGIRAD